MKRILLIAAVLFGTLTGFASRQSGSDGVSNLFWDFMYCKNAEYVHVPKLLLKLAAVAMDDEDKEDMKFLKRISSVRVLDLEECSEKIKRDFTERIKKFKAKGYEELVRQKSKDENTLVLIKMKKEYIRELVVITCDEEDCTLVQIKGKIHPDEVEDVIEHQGRNAKSKHT